MNNSALLLSLQGEEYLRLWYVMIESLKNLWDSLPGDTENLGYSLLNTKR